VVQSFDKIALSGPARNGWVQRRMQDQLGLLKRCQLTIIPQKLKESHVPWQVRFADAPKYPQIRLQ
jgi:hypothetical protein